MKITVKMTLTLLLTACLMLSACSEQQVESKTAAQKHPTTEKNANKFFDTAVLKIKTVVPGASKEQAKCMVESMLADGRMGLGEINQMSLNEDGTVKRSSVAEALNIAKTKCM